MPYPESNFLMLSALQHFLFCPRQCGLIHLEQIWQENLLTSQGNLFHERVHSKGKEKRVDIIEVRGLRVFSSKYGISGQTDVVEFQKSHSSEVGIEVRDRKGKWVPYPVEYKKGKPKNDNSDKVQLCAQALCLEEMMETQIEKGAIFYGKNRRRLEVAFDQVIREETKATIEAVHALFRTGITPSAVYAKKCDSCSLVTICLPKKTGRTTSTETYIRRMLE